MVVEQTYATGFLASNRCVNRQRQSGVRVVTWQAVPSLGANARLQSTEAALRVARAAAAEDSISITVV